MPSSEDEMKFVIDIAILLLLSSCTISISQVHSEGQASDVIDNDQKADASPAFSLPAYMVDYAFSGKDVGLS